MSTLANSTPYPRTQIFTLNDGTPVIQWGDTNVQDIATGKFRAYTPRDFGRRLSDEDLSRLKDLQIIHHFNRTYVWLYALPESGRFSGLRTQDSAPRRRYYYLNTTLPPEYLDDVQEYLVESGLADVGAEAHVRENIIAITGGQATLFVELNDAEEALQHLLSNAPDWLTAATIAFADAATFAPHDSAEKDVLIDLDALIAAQDHGVQNHTSDDPEI